MQVVIIQKFFRRWRARITVANLRYAKDQYEQFQQSQAVRAADMEHQAYEWDMHRSVKAMCLLCTTGAQRCHAGDSTPELQKTLTCYTTL